MGTSQVIFILCFFQLEKAQGNKAIFVYICLLHFSKSYKISIFLPIILLWKIMSFCNSTFTYFISLKSARMCYFVLLHSFYKDLRISLFTFTYLLLENKINVLYILYVIQCYPLYIL